MTSKKELYKQYIKVEKEIVSALKLNSPNEITFAIADILENNTDLCEPAYISELIRIACIAGKKAGKEDLQARIAIL